MMFIHLALTPITFQRPEPALFITRWQIVLRL